MVLRRLKERIPSMDPFHRLLCGDNDNCRTVRSPDDLRFKIVKEGRKIKICAYKPIEITVYTRQREKLTPTGGIEFDQNAGLKLEPLGCHEFSEDELSDDILENPSKLSKLWQLKQEQRYEHYTCSCNSYNRRKKNFVVRSC